MREQIGAGRAWAILEAREIASRDLHEGLSSVSHLAERAAAIHDPRAWGQETQLKTTEQFAAGAGEAIVFWQEKGILPVVHPDFTVDLTGRERYAARGFNIMTERPSTAMNLLRAVRLSLPEILRGHDVAPNAVKGELDGIAETLASVKRPGTMTRSRKVSGRGGWGWRY